MSDRISAPTPHTPASHRDGTPGTELLPSHVTLQAPVSFEDILDQLERLAREHLLVYRVRVGGLLLQHFWGGDAAAFSSRAPNKEARFELFFSKYQTDLARYGLSKRQARRSIRASIVVRTLPPAVAERLFLTQVLELSRLADPTQRTRVAIAAIERDWSVQDLRDAVSATQAGLPIAEIGAEIGAETSTTPPDPPQRQIAPGRLVTQAEKLAGEVDQWATRWQGADTSRLRRPQRLRLAAAVTELEAQVARLRGMLADGGGGE